jgi:uncharacterized protein YycO
MKKQLLIVSIIGLILLIILGTYLKKRYYNPWVRLRDSKEQVKLLVDNNQLRDGDIIFQTSLSRQSKAIQLATHSKYSHCGIIYKINDDYMVFEAVQPVRYTPLDKWIARGENDNFVIKRLNNADSILTPDNVKKMLKTGEYFKGKDYDIYFEWSDKNIYCSELIWKVYKRSIGIEIDKLQKLRDFDLSNDMVKAIMKKRYGNNVPLDETVISPVNIFNSELLKTIKEHY